MPLIFATFLFSFFGVAFGFGQSLQVAAIACIWLEGVRSLVARNWVMDTTPDATSTRLLVAVVIPIQSVLVGFFRGDYSSIAYSLIWLLTTWLLIIVVEYHGMLKIYKCFLLASALAVGIYLLVDFAELADSLKSPFSSAGPSRFAPLGIHPNQVSYMLGISTVCAIGAAANSKTVLVKAALGSLCAANVLIIFAAASRGSLTSLLVASSLFYLLAKSSDKNKSQITKGKVAIAAVMLAVLVTGSYLKDAADYIASALSINSQDRGINSGLSGRTAGWQVVIDSVSSDYSAIAFGHGLRSVTDATFGFSIDNAYVSLAYELGFLTTAAVVVMIFRKCIRLLRYPLQKVKFASGCILTFALIDGLVERNMLSLGMSGAILVQTIILAKADAPTFEGGSST